MNPIPITWCAAGGLALAVAGFVGGLKVQDWRRDSKDLTALQRATKDLKAAAQQQAATAKAYEQERADAQAQSTIRESTINTIYKDRVVRADCALDAAAGGVLDDAIASANARAAGQPDPAVPTAGGEAKPVH